MLTILSIQFLIFIFYVSFIYSKFGILTSISESWYSLNGNSKFLFTLFCWSLCICMILYNDLFLFLSGCGFAFVGAATSFKDSLTKWVHNIASGVAVILAFVYLLINGLYIIPIIFLILTVLIFYLTKNKIWWIELSSSILIFLGLFSIFTNFCLF